MFEARFRSAVYAGAAVLVLAAAMFVAGALWDRGRPRKTPDLWIDAPHRAPLFPLSIIDGQRYLTDASGTPFLIHGDAAWSLIADLTREETDVYLADRAARGFNSVLVNLLEHRFARHAPANAYGNPPFLTADDFSKPDEEYFAHAEWAIARAREKGMLVLLAPAYLGAHGGEDGWWVAMQAAGADRLHAYGRYLGSRFGKFDNILWVHGGDFTPPNKDLVSAIARGIRETAPRHLHTVHIAPETAVTDFWRNDDEWLDVITAYTYNHVCSSVLEAVNAARVRPVFLIESFYENEHGTGAWRTRSQAYDALLCGASGEVFGNNPIWHFHHAGIYPAPGDWWQNLGSEGARSQTVLAELFRDLPWWQLEPVATPGLIIDAQGADLPAVAARTRDGTLALVYLPSARRISVNCGQMAHQPVDARWYDPASGASTDVAGSPCAGGREVQVAPPPKSTGESDWLLVLRTRSSGPQPSPPPADLPH
jgi:hypothetical protein